MKKLSFYCFAALAFCFAAFSNVNASAQTLMEKATLEYPSGLYSAFPPGSVSITWDNQALELINPETDEYGDEYVTVYVRLGESEDLPVNAYIMYSFGNPEDPEDEDLWNLDIAMYDLDGLWDFDGDNITVIVPEGIVKNGEGAINPAQDFVFVIMPTSPDYTLTPDTGSKISSDPCVTVSFNGNPIEYLQSEIRATIYDPEYKNYFFSIGNGVTINGNNELVIDLSSLESGSYELVIPEGFVTITENGQQYLSPDIWAEYEVEFNGQDSVNLISVSPQEGKIYTLQGISAGKDIKEVTSGFYIINGKKVIVKK